MIHCEQPKIVNLQQYTVVLRLKFNFLNLHFSCLSGNNFCLIDSWSRFALGAEGYCVLLGLLVGLGREGLCVS